MFLVIAMQTMHSNLDLSQAFIIDNFKKCLFSIIFIELHSANGIISAKLIVHLHPEEEFLHRSVLITMVISHVNRHKFVVEPALK